MAPALEQEEQGTQGGNWECLYSSNLPGARRAHAHIHTHTHTRLFPNLVDFGNRYRQHRLSQALGWAGLESRGAWEKGDGGVHSEGVYRGLSLAFWCSRTRLGLFVALAPVLCVNHFPSSLGFSLSSFFFSLLFFFSCSAIFFLPFHHIIYFTSLLQIEAHAFSISLLYFEDKKVCWKDGGGRESSGTFSGGEGVLLVSGWKGGWLLSLLLCFSKSSQNHFPL